MLTKVGILTVGVTVSVLAAAPLAWAGEHGHHHGHHAPKNVNADGNTQCAAAGETPGGAGGPAGIAALAPVTAPMANGGPGGAGGSVGQSMSCNSYFNHNFDNDTVYVIPPTQK